MIEIDDSEIQKAIAKIELLKKTIKQADELTIKAVKAQVYDEIIELVERIFDAEGLDPWTPLSEDYAKRKEQSHPAKTILRREDELFAAYTDAEGTLDDYGVPLYIPYAEIHEEGLGNNPERQVFGQVGSHYQVDLNKIKEIQREVMSRELARSI